MDMKIDPTIFKAYDIRGVYPDSLNEEVAFRIARAFSEIIRRENPGKKPAVVVSYDARLSSPKLLPKIFEGLTFSGIDVCDIGLSSTPTFYFAVSYWNYDGGIQISASHNPPQWNGFKLVRARAVPISGEKGIYEIRDMVIKNVFSEISERGTVHRKEKVVDEVVEYMKRKVDLESIKPFKVVADPANAMGALDLEAVFKVLPCNLVRMNFNLDGNFPSHQPDPFKEENLVPLQKRVKSEKADLGIATDGDGDRYFFVDENGEVIRQEILRGIMAQLALKDNPGATVCYDIRPGRITKEMIDAVGGKSVMTKVGHSLIKEKMLEVDAVFGGESSGHYFYKFPFGTFEAPILLTLKFLEYLSISGKTLSQTIAPYRKYFHSGEINSEVKDKEAKMREIAEKYKDGNVWFLDGVSVDYPDFWFNVRPSNTESLLRLNLEAVSRKLMEQKRDEVLSLIRS